MKWRLFIPLLFLVHLMFDDASAAPASRAATARGPAPAPVSILSIIPAQGEPGISVTLYGSGFAEGTMAFLGTEEIPTTLLGPKQIAFQVPKLAPGLYALFLRRPDGATSKTYSFSLLPLKPVATALSPDRVDMCTTGREREVTVTGQNFLERSQVLFDGAAIRGRFLSETSMAFTVPQVNAGLHQIQVKNAEDAVSGAVGLIVNAKPEIDNITQGDEFVNYYNLVIEGRNFQQGSVVVVMEDSTLEQGGGQYSVDTRQVGGNSGQAQREKVIYVNCNRIIYQRFPYSNVLKSFRVQVLNPSGEESAPVSVSAP